MHVPFNDLYRQYLSLKDELDTAISETIRNSAFVRGPAVEMFEEQFSNITSSKYCVSCANGTDALYIAMKTLGVKPGDEVIVPAHSWISTSETVTQAGASVVFCDTTIDSFTLNPDDLERKISSKTVGIIPVHLFGHPADMTNIMRIARSNSLWVIEDCAQAHLAEHNGQKIGTFGDIATFSFYPGKNLGAMGDAGALITNTESYALFAAKFARHGGLQKGNHEIEGINSRLDGLQAAILNVKLPHLVKWTKLRQQIALQYNSNLSSIDSIVSPTELEGNEHVWHLYVIQTERRNELKARLKDRGIDTVINYPIALPFLPAYNRFGHNVKDFPIAFNHQERILSLPIFPEISQEEIEYVVDSIKKCVDTLGC